MKSQVSGGKTHVTLDWNALLGISAAVPVWFRFISQAFEGGSHTIPSTDQNPQFSRFSFSSTV